MVRILFSVLSHRPAAVVVARFPQRLMVQMVEAVVVLGQIQVRPSQLGR